MEPYAINAMTYRGEARDPMFWARHPEIIPPHVYACANLGLSPYEWQASTLDAIGQRYAVSLRAANESGKTTTVIAASLLWFLDMFGRAGGRVVVTSGSWRQVESQLIPAIRRFAYKFPEWKFGAAEIKLYGRADPQAVFFSTDNAGSAEGHHAIDPTTAPLFYIADEAKSIPDPIFEAIDRCGPQYLLIASSPGAAAGKFYRTQTDEAGMFWTRRVRSVDCPHLDPAKRQRDMDLYGAESPIFLSMHEAEFATNEEGLILKAADLSNAYHNPPPRTGGPRIAFCDFAAGGDENVIAIRDGNEVWIHAAWREADTVQAARQFIEHFKELRLQEYNVFADEGGLGIMMCDTLADEGWRINRVNNGSPAKDEHFMNLGAEIWHSAARSIARGKIIMRDADPILWRQLTTRRSEIAPGGRLRAESKKDMKARGVSSPDRADALLGAIFCGPGLFGAITDTSQIAIQQSTFHTRTVKF